VVRKKTPGGGKNMALINRQKYDLQIPSTIFFR